MYTGIRDVSVSSCDFDSELVPMLLVFVALFVDDRAFVALEAILDAGVLRCLVTHRLFCIPGIV
jgi:hypothetical protein